MKLEAEGREFATRTIYSSSEFLVTKCFFNFLLEVSYIKQIITIEIQIGKHYRDLEKVRRRFVRIAGRKQGGAPKRCTLDEKFTYLVWSQIHTPKQFEAKTKKKICSRCWQRKEAHQTGAHWTKSLLIWFGLKFLLQNNLRQKREEDLFTLMEKGKEAHLTKSLLT